MKKLIGITLVSLLAGCATQTYLVGDQQANTEAAYDEGQTFFVSGLAQTQKVDATQICNGKQVAKVQTQKTFLNGLLGSLSSGIYTPRQMRVYCK